MENMEHMAMRWETKQHETDGSWCVVARDETRREKWYVADIAGALPGCNTGEFTARAICAEHNAALENKGKK